MYIWIKKNNKKLKDLIIKIKNSILMYSLALGHWKSFAGGTGF